MSEPLEPCGGTLAKLLALQGRLGTAEEQLENLAEQVGAVAETIERLADDRKQSKPAPAWWAGMSTDEHAQRWPEFLRWLRDVLADEYPHDARRLTPCWDKHPDAVAALTALWLTWTAAQLNRAADARDAAAWEVQWRPQLIEIAGNLLNECRGAGEHRELVALPAGLLESFAG